MAASSASASVGLSIHSCNRLTRNFPPFNNCNPRIFFPIQRLQPWERKCYLQLQRNKSIKNKQQHPRLNAAASSDLLATQKDLTFSQQGYNNIMAAKTANPPLMPAIRTPGGFVDLTSVLLRNRTIFLGQYINSQVAQQVISQLVTLAAVDPDADILMYINCPGGSLYSVMAIYDCMSWIKPKVGAVCFGVAASHGALLLAGGENGMRYAMPNCRIMIHQPQGGMGGNMEQVSRQVNELCANRDKIDKMYAAFTGQPLEIIKMYTDRDYFFSAAEAMDFGMIDGILETEY